MQHENKRVLVVGGGPAGMMAALTAAQNGCRVTLLEKNEKLGKKLFITGKGRCNVTNDCAPEIFFENIAHNSRFCYSAVYGFLPQQTMAFLEEHGTPVKVERGKRVFPVSDHASDVTKALAAALKQNNVEVLLNTRLEKVFTAEGRVTGIRYQNAVHPCDALILALGGASYASTGSDGGWKEEAERLGHEVKPFRSALVPLLSDAEWVKKLQGLSLKNVTLHASLGKKTVMNELGEMLFTHFGVSGPLILTLSSLLEEKDLPALHACIDLKPGLTPEQLDKRLLRDFAAGGTKALKTVMAGLLPARLGEAVPALCGLDGMLPVNQVTAAGRNALAQTLKALPLPISGFGPLNEAIVTRGGIAVKEIDPSTMRSKKYANLFFAGEMIDVDALTGGFNIQLALSFGHLAGESAAEAI